MNKKKKIMKVREITPKEYQCAAWTCPAIFEITPEAFQCTSVACPGVFEKEEKLVIIGRKADVKKLGIANRLGKDEEAVIAPKEMLRKIFEK